MVSSTVYRYVDAAGRVHYLHGKETINQTTGRPHVLLYFSRTLDRRWSLAQLPAGYDVVVSPITGRPYARKAARDRAEEDEAKQQPQT